MASKCIPLNIFIPTAIHHRRHTPRPQHDPKNGVPDIFTMKACSFIVRFCIVQCGHQSVQVLQPDGHITEFRHTILAGDLLRTHPHHYVCNAADTKGAILPLDATLEQGNIYLLLPVPRLFPSSTSSASSTCSCYSGQDGCPKTFSGAGLIGSSPRKGTVPWCHKASKVSPEGKQEVTFALPADDACATAKLRPGETVERNKEVLLCRYVAGKAMKTWKPKLQSILEDDLFVFVEEHDMFPAPTLNRVVPQPRHRPRHVLGAVKKSELHTKLSWRRDTRAPLLSANPLFIF